MLELKDKLILFFKSFFLQSVFNYEKFQNIGLLFIISGFAKKIHSDRDELKKFIERYNEIFNTQPYMAAFVIGNIIRMEYDKKSEKDIENVKQSLACAYASIGDRIFWSRLRVVVAQFTFIIFIILYFCCYNSGIAEITFVSVFVPTLFYAIYTLYIRYVGFVYGWNCGGEKNCGLDKFNWNRIIRMSSRAAFFLSVVMFLLVIFLYGFYYITSEKMIENLIYIIVPFVGFFAQRYFRKDRKNIFYPVITVIVFSLLVCIFI
ncbi:MAG: PTS system mannose/fructose/sorbose family transporter subunit IID [Elusimicrobiales bacterium]|nr:PTS system mannose/fructose/sorbose family transporter subunit IID [Elusimicrobiales bacterium]